MNYFKEKIIRYVVEQVKTDFIHFDNFDFNYPPAADFNPAAIAAFRKYLMGKYSSEQRKERFGFEDISQVLPPMWNSENPAEKMTTINDPVIQEWIDFRCWTFTTRLAECARFARELNKEVVIETNPHGLVGSDRAWEAGINHSDLMQYTNAIWTEDENNPRWENGVSIGKFRHYKLGRTTNNFILTNSYGPEDYAEELALNRTIGYLGEARPEGITKKYLDFWTANKDLYINMKGDEKVAILRSYPSMAYNTLETQMAVNMAEQVLQQRQIPFDIIFDQQLGQLDKYYALVLADQESLTDEAISAITTFVGKGGGLVITGNTGMFDGWRRLRKQSIMSVFLPVKINETTAYSKYANAFQYGQGKVIYLPELVPPSGEIKLGFESTWFMPKNANELESAIFWVSKKKLPLIVTAPEWIGVSNDTQENREIIHLFNYKHESKAAGITLEYRDKIKSVWAVSPDQIGKTAVTYIEENGISIIKVPLFNVYEILVIEKK